MKHNKQNKHEDKISQTANIDAADVTGAHVTNYFHRNPNLREISLCSRPNCNEVVATRHGLQIWTQKMKKIVLCHSVDLQNFLIDRANILPIT